MRPKVTYRERAGLSFAEQYPTRVGWIVDETWVPTAAFTEAVRIERVGVPPEKRPPYLVARAALIGEAVVARDFRAAMAAGHAKTPAGDVRLTLERLARIPDDASAASALERCDATTEALIDAALWRLRTTATETPLHLRVRAAAGEALKAYAPPDGRRPSSYQSRLAEGLLGHWHACTGDALPAVSHGETLSPFVRFAQLVFDAVEGRSFDTRKLADLLLEARGSFYP